MNPRRRRLQRHRRAERLEPSFAADCRAMARACWYWYLSRIPRQLTPCSPAEDEGAQEEHDAESSIYYKIALNNLREVFGKPLTDTYGDPHIGAHVVRALHRGRDDRLGRAAAKAVRDELRSIGARGATIQAFGVGWRKVGQVHVSAE